LFVILDHKTLEVKYEDGKTLINFNWDFPENSKCAGQSKCSSPHIKVFAKINSTGEIQTVDVHKQPAQIAIEPTGYINQITLCSSLTQRADGAGTSNKKTTTYCDEKLPL